MIKMDVKADIKDARLSLEALGASVGGSGFVRRVIRALSTAGKKWIKKRMGGFLHIGRNMRSSDFKVQEGLKESIYGFARSADHGVVASGKGYIAEPLERGATIKPKKGKFLSFRGDDETWHRMKSVTIPARHWFTKSAEGFEQSSEYLPTVEKMIGKEIKRAGLSR